MKTLYLATLGREAVLSRAELSALFGTSITWHHFTSHSHALFLSDKAITTAQFDRLGGLVSCAQAVPDVAPTPEHIAEWLNETQPEGKIVFSWHGQERVALEIKKALKAMDRSCRYVAPKNTATILHNDLVTNGFDLSIANNTLFRTCYIQPIEDWSERDFGRPGRDAKSGMLPPKLARMLINLSKAPTSATLLDPFCGSGTVLSEALLIGFEKVIGADISDKAIADTEKNCAWVAPHAPKPRLFTTPAETLLTSLTPNSVDVIVTEPYLGKPLSGNDTSAFLERQRQELQTLYLRAFTQFHKLLTPGGTVVFIFPAFRQREGWLKTSSIVHEIKKLGFATDPFFPDTPTILYVRPDQHVGREIIRFKKTPG